MRQQGVCDNHLHGPDRWRIQRAEERGYNRAQGNEARSLIWLLHSRQHARARVNLH